MEFSVPEEIERLCDGVRRFMDDEIYPRERKIHWKPEVGGPAYPPEVRAVQEKAKKLGFWAFHLPKEAGGAGIPFMHYVLVNEILGRSPLAPVCVGSQAPDSGNAELLWRFGTEDRSGAGSRRSSRARSELLLDDRAEVAGSDPKLLQCHGGAMATSTSSTATSGSRAARTARASRS
jgi:alkylation response protein AidB-like acyl-CoA dehydrogenase